MKVGNADRGKTVRPTVTRAFTTVRQGIHGQTHLDEILKNGNRRQRRAARSIKRKQDADSHAD